MNPKESSSVECFTNTVIQLNVAESLISWENVQNVLINEKVIKHSIEYDPNFA